MKEFPAAPLDTTAKVVSTLLVVVLLGVAVVMYFVLDGVVLVLTVMAYTAILVASWGFAPHVYVLQGDDLVVLRRLGPDFRARLRGLADIDRPGHLGLRVAGSGGGFGYYGRFRRRDLGTFRAYLTTRSDEHVVALQTDSGVVMISPHDATAFRQALTGGTP